MNKYKQDVQSSQRNFGWFPSTNQIPSKTVTSSKRSYISPQGRFRRQESVHVQNYRFKGQSYRQKQLITDYRSLVDKSQLMIPNSLLKDILFDFQDPNKNENLTSGKVKIMLKVTNRKSEEPNDSKSDVKRRRKNFLKIDCNQRHINIYNPDFERSCNVAPKKYSFDAVFSDKTFQEEINLSSLNNVIQSVLQGADGTVLCYGQSGLGKTSTLLQWNEEKQEIGIIPSAISWIFQSINELRKRHVPVSYKVKVSAIEVYGRTEKLKDLLAEGSSREKIRVVEDPVVGAQMHNVNETFASSASDAGFLLDVAISNRSCSGSRSNIQTRRHSHLIFTLNLYRNEEETANSRSRLHFIDLGSCDRNLVKTSKSLALSFSSLGHVIMAIVNNSKHVPFRESRLTCVLRELLGNINCRVSILAHVSTSIQMYQDTLSTVQMASRIHRVLRKKSRKQMKKKVDESPTSFTTFTSGSEMSCDTVIFNRSDFTSDSDDVTRKQMMSRPAMLPTTNKTRMLSNVGRRATGCHGSIVTPMTSSLCIQPILTLERSELLPMKPPTMTSSAVRPLTLDDDVTKRPMSRILEEEELVAIGDGAFTPAPQPPSAVMETSRQAPDGCDASTDDVIDNISFTSLDVEVDDVINRRQNFYRLTYDVTNDLMSNDQINGKYPEAVKGRSPWQRIDGFSKSFDDIFAESSTHLSQFESDFDSWRRNDDQKPGTNSSSSDCEIEKMPELDCCYTLPRNIDSNQSKKSSKSAHMTSSSRFADSFNAPFRLYDSNSLQISYLDTRLESAISHHTDLASAAVTSFRSSESPFNIRRPSRAASSSSFVVSTSTGSTDGTRLTLVKNQKNKHQRPTLELMVTDGSDKESVCDVISRPKACQRKPEKLRVSAEYLLSIKPQKKDSDSKKTRWFSGLMKFASKKSEIKSSKTSNLFRKVILNSRSDLLTKCEDKNENVYNGFNPIWHLKEEEGPWKKDVNRFKSSHQTPAKGLPPTSKPNSTKTSTLSRSLSKFSFQKKNKLK